jgi:ADP-ribose pyrophosphatase YjhB (NUDIX family)
MISGTKSAHLNPAMYFTAGVSVVCAIFGYEEGQLYVMLIRRRFEPCLGQWALPGVMLHPEENVDEVRDYLIREVTGLDKAYTKEIRAFTDKSRHPLGRVINVGFYSAVLKSATRPAETAFALESKWFPVEKIPPLVFDHATVLKSAKKRLGKRMRRHPVAFQMLPERFTMPEVHNLFEQVFEKEIDKRNFSRKVLQSELIVDSGEKKMQQDHVGRLPRLYSFDWEAYKEERDQKIRFDY